MKPAFKKVLLKLSGESLATKASSGVDKKACELIVSQIKSIHELGVQIGIVIGGGNFFRGTLAKECELGRVPADHIGMLATVMNGIFLAEALKKAGISVAVMGSKDFGGFVKVFNQDKAWKYLEQNKVVLFVGGTGNPYFTTDSAAALRACEMQAEVLLKATKVDGVYNKDPLKFPDAKKYATLTYAQALSEDLQVMDAMAIALCRDAKIPIFVFDLFAKDAFTKALCKLEGGTRVS
jgi:uridylate kinase